MHPFKYLQAVAVPETVAGETIPVVPVAAELEWSRAWGISPGTVQRWALNWGFLPARYLRNYGTVGLEGQRRLLKATVAVVGAGGLGGLVLELLARMGVGRLLLTDADCFEDNNLNRQLLAKESNLGASKVREAARRVREVNSGVFVEAADRLLTEDNAGLLLEPAQVAVDALDNLPGRRALQKGCRDRGIPLVHGAIAGFQGQVMTIFPGDAGIEFLYGNGAAGAERGVEQELGNPAATPAMVAAWQAQEVVKVLVNRGEPLQQRLLYLDAWTGECQVLHL